MLSLLTLYLSLSGLPAYRLKVEEKVEIETDVLLSFIKELTG